MYVAAFSVALSEPPNQCAAKAVVQAATAWSGASFPITPLWQFSASAVHSAWTGAETVLRARVGSRTIQRTARSYN